MNAKEFKAHLYHSKMNDCGLKEMYREILFLHQKNRLANVIIRNSNELIYLKSKIVSYKKAIKKLNEIQDTVNTFWRYTLWLKINKRILKIIYNYEADAIKHDKAAELYFANIREYQKLTKNINFKLRFSK